MKLEIHAQKKFVPSVDSTGKRLSQDEINAHESSNMVGSLDIKIYSEGLAIIAFRCTVIAGKNSRFVSYPARKNAKGEWTNSFELGNEITEAINANGLRTMRQAEQLGTSLTAEFSL